MQYDAIQSLKLLKTADANLEDESRVWLSDALADFQLSDSEGWPRIRFQLLRG